MLKDRAMIPILQCKPDRRVKIDPEKFKEELKEEKRDVDEEGSDSGVEDDEQEDQESMAYENQSSSSSSTETENSELMMTGSSFWVSEIGNQTPSASKSKVGDNESSEKFIQRLREEEGTNKIDIIKKPTNKVGFKLDFKKLTNMLLKQKTALKKTEELKKKENGISINLNKDLLAPGKNDLIETKSSMNSVVSNKYKISIIEQNEESEFLKKITNHSKPDSSSPKDEEKLNGSFSEEAAKVKISIAEPIEDTLQSEQEPTERTEELKTEGEEQVKKPKRKRKKKKKSTRKNQLEQVNPEAKEITIPDRIEVEGEKENEEKAEVEVPVPEDKEPIKLSGLQSVDKPVNLDKFLLSDQTNSILRKIKKKKKKKRSAKNAETPDTKETENNDIGREAIKPIQKLVTTIGDQEKPTLSDLKIKSKVSVINTNNVSKLLTDEHKLFMASNLKMKEGDRSSQNSLESAKKKKLGKLRKVSRSPSISGRDSDRLNDSSIDGGDLDPKEFYKQYAKSKKDKEHINHMNTIKMLESGKASLKHELMNGSVSSKSSIKVKNSSRYG